MSDKTPYKVPVGYFQTLEKSILSRTMLSRENSVKSDELPVLEHLLAPDTDDELDFDIAPRVDIGVDIAPAQKFNWRSLAGLAACFIAIIVLAKVGAYLVTDTALENEAMTADQIELLEMEMLDIDENQLIDMLSEEQHIDPLLAQAVLEYVDYYGGVTTDSEEFTEEQ